MSDEGGLLDVVEFFSSAAILFACSSILALSGHSLWTTGACPARYSAMASSRYGTIALDTGAPADTHRDLLSACGYAGNGHCESVPLSGPPTASPLPDNTFPDNASGQRTSPAGRGDAHTYPSSLGLRA